MDFFCENVGDCQCRNSCFQSRNTSRRRVPFFAKDCESFEVYQHLSDRNYGRLIVWIFWCWARIHTHFFRLTKPKPTSEYPVVWTPTLGLLKWMKYGSIRTRKRQTNAKKRQTRVIWKHHPPISLKKTLSLVIQKKQTQFFLIEHQ